MLSSAKITTTTTETIATVVKSSPILDRRIEETTAGLPDSYAKGLRSVSEENIATIIEYIAAMKSEVNLSDHYRKDLIRVLSKFSKYHNNRPFKDLTRTNVIAFLETFRNRDTGPST